MANWYQVGLQPVQVPEDGGHGSLRRRASPAGIRAMAWHSLATLTSRAESSTLLPSLRTAVTN